MEQLLTELAKNGGLVGIIVAVFGLALRTMYVDGKASQGARVQDAQAVVDKILGMVQRMEESKRELTSALNENTEVTRQLAERCPGSGAASHNMRRG